MSRRFFRLALDLSRLVGSLFAKQPPVPVISREHDAETTEDQQLVWETEPDVRCDAATSQHLSVST